MSEHPSITRRLVLWLIVVQIVMLFATVVGVAITSPLAASGGDTSVIDGYAEYHARILLADSLRRGADARLNIEPTPALLDYAREHPSFRYAALDPDTRQAVPGSSMELVADLTGNERIELEATKFRRADETGAQRQGYLKRQITPAGAAILIAYGYAFGAGDVFFVLRKAIETIYKSGLALIFTPLIVASAAIAFFVVRHGLKPLGQAVASAQGIDLDSLHQRLETAFVPTEIMPLVGAINAALARVDAGVARQRRFLANAAHELRTPVAVLNARIDAPHRPNFDVDIKRDVRRIRNIVEQLLVASRLGERPEEMNDAVDLVDAAQTQVADHTLLAIKGGCEIDFDAPPAPVRIRGNRRAIETIVANLVDNALRAEPSGGTVRVVVGVDATISVIDHGEGVDPADRETIFEAFWRKNESTPGTGLGLAIVSELVALHGGSISVSDTPGGGATFFVTFPR